MFNEPQTGHPLGGAAALKTIWSSKEVEKKYSMLNIQCSMQGDTQIEN
jgi:hypothetical protein